MISGESLNTKSGPKEFFARNRQAIIVTFKLLIAAGLLAFIISKIHPSEILSAVESANPTLIGVAFLLLFVNIYLQFLKWKIVCGRILGVSDNKTILISLFHGLTAGSFTPARVGEYFGRAMAFRDKPFMQVTVATVVDKFFLLLVVALAGAVSSVMFLHYYYNLSLPATTGLLLLVAAVLYLLVYVFRHPGLWNNPLFDNLPVSGKISSFLEKLSVIKNLDMKFSIKLGAVTGLFYICIIAQYVILAAAFSNHMDPLHFAWAGMLVMFAKSIVPPVAIADLGVREGASVFFLAKFGEIKSVGFNSSIFMFLINILIPAIIGLFFLLKKNDD